MSKNKKNKNHKKTLIPKTSFSATLTMLSDWHVGLGAGRAGDIDRLIQRDRYNLPYIPAKTVTGIWRDACESVALGLDNGSENGAWKMWVDFLFGDQPADPNSRQTANERSPRPAALSVRAACLPKCLQQVLENKPVVKEVLTFVKTGISIDPVSGCAKEDFLRLEEMVRGGTILEIPCELNLNELDEAQQKAAYALLLAGAKFLERLGGKRRRGAGRCKLVIEENIENWIKWIQDNPEPTLPPIWKELTPLPEEKIAQSFTESQQNLDDTWLKVELTITTKSPVTIAKRTVGNVVESLDYIPGTYLLGLAYKKLSSLGVNINQAIAQGNLLVTNATIQIDKQQGRAVPLALFYEKLGGGFEKGKGVYNLLVEPEPEGQLRPYRQGYIGSTNTSLLPKYENVEQIIQTHNTVNDEFQRPTSDVGSVYSYEAIASGTTLKAELRLHKELANVFVKNKKDLCNLLRGNERIGQSKKDDYGLVFIEASELKIIEPSIKLKDKNITIWLLSDVLLRDERLRPTTDLDVFKKTLKAALGVKLKEPQPDNQRTRTRRTDSWQVRWGLPRPSLAGLTAGSCLVFEVEEILDSTQLEQLQARLAQIEAQGIGERRAEGYGQIRFNDPLLTSKLSEFKVEEAPKSENTQPQNQPQSLHPNNANAALIAYARIIEREAWREAIRRAALALAATREDRQKILGIKIVGDESYPPMSQLGTFKSVLKRLQEPADSHLVIHWIDNLLKLDDVNNRKEKWSKTDDSLSKIHRLVISPEQIWTELSAKLSTPWQDLTLIEGAERVLTSEQWEAAVQISRADWKEQGIPEVLPSELWSEAVRTLVDACIRAHKRDWEKSELIETEE